MVAGPSQSSDHRTCVLLWYSVGLSAPMACRVVLSAIHGAIAAHLSNLCSLRTPLTPYHPRACVVRRRTNQVLRSPEYFWMLSMFAISILIRFGEKKFNAVLILGHAALPRQIPKKVFCGLSSPRSSEPWNAPSAGCRSGPSRSTSASTQRAVQHLSQSCLRARRKSG